MVPALHLGRRQGRSRSWVGESAPAARGRSCEQTANCATGSARFRPLRSLRSGALIRHSRRMLVLYAAATALVASSSRVVSGAVAPVVPAPRLGQLTLNSDTAVVDALTKLFKAFDTNNDGFVSLSSMLLADRSAAATGGEWESRQARG